MFDNPPALAALVAAIVFFSASGASVSFLLGRRSARGALLEQRDGDGPLPDHIAKELVRCLELADYVVRDADTLTAAVASQAAASRPVTTAVNQLTTTAKSLVARLNCMGASAHVTRPSLGTHTVGATISLGEADSPLACSRPSPLAGSTAFTAAEDKIADGDMPSLASEAESRRFPRRSFKGTAWATIYPQHSSPGREPIRCEVLTRDLSCGGIGIAYTEPLFPKQIVVLDAVGKLLVSEVRWCRRVDENFYVAGCRLVKTSS